MKTPFWFRRFNLIALSLIPLAVIYCILSKIVFIFRSFCVKRSKRPVICVGGILAGGIGKTPIVREIAKYLNAPIIMRGYRARDALAGRPVNESDSSRDAGDEAKMLALSGLSVYVGDRGQNIDVLDFSKARGPVLMDDGFQNPRIKKDVSILSFDEAVGLGNGMLLPAGPLREGLRSGLRRADTILINHDGGARCLRVMKLAKKMKKPVFFVKKELDTAGFFGKYVAFAGIGYPSKFFDALRDVPAIRVVDRVSFADHHFYSKDDIIRLFRQARELDARLVCTEKDWVKLPRNIQQKVRFVPLKITIQPNFYLWLEKKLGKERAACYVAPAILK